MSRPKTLSTVAALWTGALMLSLPAALNGAPGTLVSSPLFLSNTVEPNVFFTLDDSGSMEWDLLVSGGSSGIPSIGGWSGDLYILPTKNNGYDTWYWQAFGNLYPYTVPDPAYVADAWRLFNASYNTIYYNPAVTYKPWQGTDAGGAALYSNASPTAAPVDPNSPAGNTLNLTVDFTIWNYSPSLGGWYLETTYPAKHYTWTDTDLDGVVDTTDGKALVQIVSTTANYTTSADRTDCAAAPTCTYAEEIQNFANWFTYYRKRKFTAKNAMGSVINAAANARMGLQLFNNGLVQNVASMATAANKRTLLQNLYDQSIPCDWTDGCPGTPARTALKSVGDLFEGGSSPILSQASGGNCQQNFNILMSDGYWNGSSPSLGNVDGDGSSAYDGGDYADTYSDTLADVAMYYYERDLKGTIDDDVPTTTGVDEASHQHLVNYTVGFGLTGTLDPFNTKTPGTASDSDPADAAFNWPDPTDVEDDQRVDDLWHTAYNSRGEFYSASNPSELITSLNSAITSIADRTGSAAAVAFNSSTLGTDTSVFLALFNSNMWQGDLISYPLDPNTGEVGATSNWSAKTQLDARSLSVNPRTILTWSSTAVDGVPFQWANITTAQKNDLKTTPSGGVSSDAVGQSRLDFLRGDRSNEGTGNNFRTRGSRLGDFIDSTPVYAGKPSMGWPDTAPFPTLAGETYGEFVTANKTRTGIVYIGGNGGMMHGFDADTGEEVLAYVPAYLFSTTTTEGLHYLADPAYIHRYYVDLPPTVTDAYVKTTVGGAASWRTLLLGGSRAGGKGFFALDVTDPTTFSDESGNADDIVLWEFTSSSNSDLGYTFAEPTVAMLPDGNWYAIFGNGYNASGNYPAKLFLIKIEGGLDGTWTLNSDYYVISTCKSTFTNSDCVGTSSARNGLSTPAVIDTDGDGAADRAYAGDLKGNMWAFDLSDATPSNWAVAYVSGSTPKPLFTAASNQPITVQPVVTKHPTIGDSSSPSNAPNVMIYFGTGQYVADGDNLTTNTQAFYGVWDDGNKEIAVSQLQSQTLEADFDPDYRVVTDNSVAYTATGGSKRYGWYINLPDSGERVVVNSSVRGTIVYFNTLVPSNEPCSNGGYGWLMSVKMENGGRPTNAIFDINGDNVVDSADLLDNTTATITGAAPSGEKLTEGNPAESTHLGNRQYTPSTATTTGTEIDQRQVETLTTSDTGRLSWREVLDQ